MNNNKVTTLPPSVNFTAEQALQSALNLNDLTDVLIIGYQEDGELFVRSSKMTRCEAVFLAEKAKYWAFDAE